MPHSTNKELILGIMVGTAGISLLALWYHKVRKLTTTMSFPKFLSLDKKLDSLTLQDESHSEQGTSAVFQRRQVQILEKVNELLTNMEELKEEIRFLKETIPKLEEYIQDELGGKVTVHKVSPQHRARKKRVTTVQSSATSNSSEEAESEGGCWKEDQSSPTNYSEDQVTLQHRHHGTSLILQPKVALGCIKCRPSSTCKLNRRSSSSSSISNHSFLSKRKNSLLARFQTRQRQQSRVNFDSQEDLTSSSRRSSDHISDIRFRKSSSSRKLSIVSCCRNNIVYDTPRDSQNLSHANAIKVFSKMSADAGAQNRPSLFDSDHGNKYFSNLEAVTMSSGLWTVARTSYSPSLTTSLFSLPTVVSSSSEVNISLTENCEDGQLNKDSEDALHHRSQSQSRDHSPTGIEQHLSQNITSASLLHEGFSSSYKNVNSLTAEVSSGPFEEENFPASSLNEDIPSPTDKPGTRSLRFSFL